MLTERGWGPPLLIEAWFQSLGQAAAVDVDLGGCSCHWRFGADLRMFGLVKVEVAWRMGPTFKAWSLAPETKEEFEGWVDIEN